MSQSKPIRSAANPRFKAALKLLTSRGRSTQNRIAIFGAREAHRALSGGAQIEELFVLGQAQDRDDRELRSALQSRVPVWELSAPLFQRLSYGERHDALLAIARRPDTSLKRLRIGELPLVVVLEGVEKPGNIGAVARSADVVGASALILAEPVCDVFHPNSIRASLGCVFQIPVATGSSSEVRNWLRQCGLAILATRVDAATNYTTVDFRQPTAIVLGSEARGLSPAWHGGDVREISLPMRGISDSLNVSVTAAVIMFEALRQRTT